MIRELRIRTPDNKVKRVPLDEASLALGRAHTNDLCYPEDASLSRRHLTIDKGESGWSVTDLGSKNGTMLNGSRITRGERLSPGDHLVVGQLNITCVDPDNEEDRRVVFVPAAGTELEPGATVMTSLEGLLSGEATAPINVAQEAGKAFDAAQEFRTPVVRALIRAGRELAGHRPVEELFPLILELSIEAVNAERGVLMTLEGNDLVSRACHGEGFCISTTVRDRVLVKKDSLLVRDVGQEEALLKQLSISEQHIHSLMAVPLQTQKEVIGLIYVDSRLFVREFTPDDLNLLTVLANVAAIRIDHERHLQLQQQEERRTLDLEQAAEIQRGILPSDPPSVPGLDLAGFNAPCRTVGGDYYDFIEFKDGRVALVLGDVAGKGMSAALLMSSLQARVQLLTEETPDLAELTSRLDRSIASRCPNNRFITFFICLVDPETGNLIYCNAGHNPAIIVRASGEVETLEAVGTVLGILPELGYSEQHSTLGRGDLIAIYSDGVTEAVNLQDAEYGQDRLTEILIEKRNESAEDIVSAVNDSLASWCSSAPVADDITLVIARRID